ncbi:hypothetical protein MMC18_001275 [Xylographa bjoerkii]|nr:hypothetical protein [Xylographa bjoerkii]
MSYFGGRNRSRSRATFERACPPLSIPEDEYASERSRAYPTATRKNLHPDPDERRSYDRYKAYQYGVENAEADYGQDSERALSDYKRVTGTDDNMKAYYTATSGSLLPRHHGELHATAADLEEISYRHANARADHFTAHPRSYETTGVYEEHRHQAKRAYIDHEAYDALHREHGRLAPDPYSENRDLYGNEVSRGLRPVPGRYPPLPPPGHYYTGGPSISDVDRKPVIFEMKPRSSR